MAKKSTTSRRATAADKGPSRARSARSSSTAPKPEAQPGTLDAAADAIGQALGRTTAAIARHLPWTHEADGLDLLEQDHRRLEALVKQAVDTDPKALADRKSILGQLARELVLHEQLEEKVLYPALKSHPEGKDIVLEGYQEHHVADVLLKELQEMPPSDERWGAKMKVLKESLEHHIEEEEGEMFKTARAVFDGEQLAAIGQRMQAMKDAADRPSEK